MTSSRAAPNGGPQPFSFLSLDLFEIRFAVGGGYAWFDPDVAREAHFGTSGAAFDIELGVELFDLVSMAVNFGSVFPPDHAGFSNEVVPAFEPGSVQTLDTQLQIPHVEWTIGPRTPSFCLIPLERQTESGPEPIDNCVAVHVFARFGHMGVQAERIFPDCVDCSDQTVDLPNGAILDTGLEFGFPSRQGIGMFLLTGFRQSLGQAAIRNHLRFELGIGFL